MGWMRSAVVACLLVLVGCRWGDAPSEEATDGCARTPAPWSGPVEVDGGELVVDGAPFVPRGIGSYPLLQHAGNGRMADIHDVFEQAVALGRPLVRTNAFFDGGSNPARIRDDHGRIREAGLEALDRVLEAAEAHDVRLILVLANNWSHYGGAPAVVEMAAPGEGLPKDAFWSEPRAVRLQKTYLQTLAARINTRTGVPYARDPTLFAWELVNEARCERDRWCDGEALVDWARMMAHTLRDGGVRQPIAWGGAGHLGRHGEDLRAIARDGCVDLLTLHVYPFASHSLHLDARGEASRLALGIRLGMRAIAQRARIARRHRMPLLVEELGWKGPDAERALVLGAWLRAARREGVGTLPWMIGERGRPDYDGLLIRPAEDLATVHALRCE